MRQIALFIVVLTIFSAHVDAGLDDLIKQNIQDAAKSYDRTLSPVQRSTEPARLWVHVRSDSQERIGDEILNIVTDTKLEERSIEWKPVQVVDFGPRESQLRYFKRQDESEARELFGILRGLIPQLELKDLSRQFARVGWIKSGHYELWLSPDIVRLEPLE